jgi:hypothetical protein
MNRSSRPCQIVPKCKDVLGGWKSIAPCAGLSESALRMLSCCAKELAASHTMSNWPKTRCRKCGREIYFVKSQHGQWFAYDSIEPFVKHRHGSDVYELPDHERVPLFIPRENKYRK